ncbi:hypothetical protein IGB42_04217 [Andreprevotia sp. IGB-42]|uniref:HD domain-containing protein n=1 Tax=Andreprevotia sp. IGB-42 TaxID=2497473 RepID=UPI0013569157|nr:N-methyl-D-aspartate receptor NMDAR2C subunit [Andreprevotia sp. IGB-42]KAF0811322.1 hypothetical protein IGB42_04217 [Andreprevotia sp. IGB-42]
MNHSADTTLLAGECIDWQANWHQAWSALGCVPDTALLPALLQRYGEVHRHYHTLQHLAECLAWWQQVQHLAERPAEIAIALWFHDAIYAPRRRDNEQQSADWARAAVLAAGGSLAIAGRIQALVMATCHHAQPLSHDAHLLVDIDLSILGAGAVRFAQYQQQIRQEYAWVPALVFRPKRRAVLLGFLQRPQLYGSAYFNALLEECARANLQAAARWRSA